MADIRALMAQERQARRINHEFATYSKSSVLTCTICQLNIKSEALWDGHLRSANHKANVKKSHEAPRNIAKRKIEDVEEPENSEELDTRKKLKPKPRSASETITESIREESIPDIEPQIDTNPVEPAMPPPQRRKVRFAQGPDTYTVPIDAARMPPTTAPPAQVDENEWAAFERDVAPLAQPDYSAATITAAPVSAEQLEAEAESDRRKLRDNEAEDEREEEGRRLEDEFDLMEEMEERVRKLKEKREAVRLLGQSAVDTGQTDLDIAQSTPPVPSEEQDDSDDSEEDIDDWYS